MRIQTCWRASTLAVALAVTGCQALGDSFAYDSFYIDHFKVMGQDGYSGMSGVIRIRNESDEYCKARVSIGGRASVNNFAPQSVKRWDHDGSATGIQIGPYRCGPNNSVFYDPL